MRRRWRRENKKSGLKGFFIIINKLILFCSFNTHRTTSGICQSQKPSSSTTPKTPPPHPTTLSF